MATESSTPPDPLLVVVLGPTGSGKSALAISLAERFSGEIVSCDSVAVYRHFEIGTAKPSREDRTRVQHRLIDVANPDEAFTALSYLVLGAGKTRLLNSISAFPALKADQPSFFAQLEQQKNDKGKLIYPPNVNWQVVTDAIPFADIDPNSENAMPNYNKSLDTLAKYLTRWTSTPGLDMDAEFAKLKTELQAVWDSAP